MKLKRILASILAICMVLSIMGFTVLADEAASASVAKVGNTEYATIDEAIENWTNGTTLTLLDDVTLSDVIKLSSTEHHILDLGTYTMTAASGKNAIEITCEGRTSASYAITVNADAENPGGISATGKACIYYSKSDTTKDRPIIRIYNGVFNGSYSINSKSNGNTNCPQVWIYGGTFNGNVNLTKNMLRVFGGTFNGWINCTGDSSAYREISGGRFKSWQFMTADADTKFWVGTSKDNYDVGLYVDDEGYLVVGGDVITEYGDKFEACSANYSGWSSYLKYSSAVTNGLYYTSIKEALADNNKSTGSVTVYVDELDMTDIAYNGTIVVPEGKTLTITNAPEGLKTEGNAVIVKPVADTTIDSIDELKNAIDIAQPGDTIVIGGDIASDSLEVIEVNKDLTITGNAVQRSVGGVTLTNVGINAVGECSELTVSGLSFAGNSWINSGAASNLTVSDVTANVTPNNTTYTNSRSAFISLGRVEGKELELIVENSNIVANGGANPILGWATITNATISENTFGSATAYQTNSDSVKFMAIADDAEFTITGNTVYSNYNGFVFGQNTTRANAYTAIFEDNTFIGGADHVWIEVSGANTTHATINATSGNTVNGNAFAVSDIKVHPNVTTWTSYAGVGVITDANGKVIGGQLASFSNEEVIADGYELDENGNVVVAASYVAKIGDTYYATLEEAFKAVTVENNVVEILEDVTVDYLWNCRSGNGAQFTVPVTINGNNKTIKFTDEVKDNNWNTVFRFEADATVKDLTIDISEATLVQRVITAKKSLAVDGLTIIGSAKYGIIFGEGSGAEDLAEAEISIANSTLNGTRRAISDNENGKDVKSVAITDNTLNANVYVSAYEAVTFTGNTVTGGYVDIRSYTANNSLNVTATDNTLEDNTQTKYNYIKAGGTIDAQGGFVIPWDGVTISNLEEFKMFRDAVNAGDSYAGKTVTLTADIDLTGENWVAIGSATQEHGFMGNFDGQNHKIMNLTITDPALDSDGYAYAGLFGITEGTDKDNQNIIKNLTIENVDITTDGHIASAAIAYPYYTIVENVTVCGDIAINGGNYTAGILAYTRRCVNASKLTIEGNEGSYITGAQVVGGVISDIQMNGGLIAEYSDFNAEGLTISGDLNVGGISGIIASQTLNTCSVKNVTIDCDDNRQGIVAGSLGGVSTISNVTTDNVTGATAIVGANYDQGAAVEAKIGDTYYATLEAAAKAAKEGDTITLLTDIEDVVEIPEGVTLDTNGYEFGEPVEVTTYEELVNALAKENANVIMMNDITGTATNGGYNLAGIVINAGDVLDGNGYKLTINGANGTWDCAVAMTGGTVKNLTVAGGFRGIFMPGADGDVVIDNVKFENVIYTFNSDAGSTNYSVTIKNTTLNGWTSYSAVHKSVAFEDCTFGEGSGYAFLRPYQATTFTGCEFNEGFEFDTMQTAANTLEFNDCTYAGEELSADVAGPLFYDGGSLIINGEAVVLDKYVPVAQIGNVKYISLNEAFEAAQDGDTIKLINDVELDTIIANTKNVTLDLNGKTITGTDNTEKNFSLIDNRCELTITGNGKMTLTATVNSGWNRYSAVIANNPGGKLVIENGTIEHLGGTDMAYGIDNLTNGKGTYAETIINGGTIKSTYRGIRQFLNGVDADNILTVNGGTVEGANKSIWMQDPSKNSNTGKLTVADGARLNGDVYLFVTADSVEWPVEVSIAAGAVNGEVISANVPFGYEVVNENGIYGVKNYTSSGYKVIAVADKTEVRYNNGNPDSFTVEYIVTGGNVIGGMAQLEYDNTLFVCAEDADGDGVIKMNSNRLETDADGKTLLKKLNFTVKANPEETTTYTFIAKYVQVVSDYDAAGSGTQDGFVEDLVGFDVTVVAQYDVTLPADGSLAGNTYVDVNADYAVAINNFDENKIYTITYTMDGVETTVEVTKDNVVDDGFIIENVTGDIEFTEVTDKLNCEIVLLPDVISGYTLVMVKDGVSAGYTYDGAEMYAVVRYVGLTEVERDDFVGNILNATSVRAILVEGGVTEEEARALIAVSDIASTTIEENYDVNRNGAFYFNDAMVAHGCYKKQYDLAARMAWYLASDVNTDFVVDTSDYDDAVEAFWATLDLD